MAGRVAAVIASISAANLEMRLAVADGRRNRGLGSSTARPSAIAIASPLPVDK